MRAQKNLKNALLFILLISNKFPHVWKNFFMYFLKL
jgi:hypothetical protein